MNTVAIAAAPTPWRSMWFSPRRTLRVLTDAETRPGWLLVAALAAIFSVVTALQRARLDGTLAIGDSTFPIAVGLMQFGFGIFISPFFLGIVGGWLGGQGDPKDLRQAVVWSYLPQAVAAIPCVVLLASIGAAGVNPDAASPVTVLLLLLWSLITMVAGLWTIVLVVASVAEVHRFSVGRAIATFLILGVPLILVGLVSRLI